MNKTFLALALVALPTAILAQAAGKASRLPSAHVVCRNLEQAMAITDSPTVRVRDDRDHGFQMIVIIHSRAA
jgi:hypothetical protein